MDENRKAIFLRCAEAVSFHSNCKRKRVGAVILSKTGVVLANGWNKVKDESVCETCHGPGCLYVIHAEEEAIARCKYLGESLEGGTMFVTLSPCLNCAKMIYASGIKEVVYIEKYRKTEGIDYLIQSGVKVTDGGGFHVSVDQSNKGRDIKG